MRHHDHEGGGGRGEDLESVDSTMERERERFGGLSSCACGAVRPWHSLAHGTLFNIHFDIM